jgi:hypothetical protein
MAPAEHARMATECCRGGAPETVSRQSSLGVGHRFNTVPRAELLYTGPARIFFGCSRARSGVTTWGKAKAPDDLSGCSLIDLEISSHDQYWVSLHPLPSRSSLLRRRAATRTWLQGNCEGGRRGRNRALLVSRIDTESITAARGRPEQEHQPQFVLQNAAKLIRVR